MPFDAAPKTEQEQRVAIGRIALEAIAAHILTVPPENFNMAHWCGTACCAIGHGVRLPEVQATGLRLAIMPGYSRNAEQRFPAYGDSQWGGTAIANAFGISEADALMLFASVGMGQTGEQVSERIHQFLRGELKPAPRNDNIVYVGSDWPLATWTNERISFFSWDSGPSTATATKKIAKPQPAKKLRVNSKTGATWPTPKHCYA